MTDEPREKHQPENEEVEAHGPIGPSPVGPLPPLHIADEDVEAHGPIGPSPVGPLPPPLHSDDDEDVEAHGPIGAPLPQPPVGP